jgi:hypothetical protein
MPWLNAVQDRILQEIYQHADAKKQLMEALRWRGFPVVAAAGQIQLVPASAVTDGRDLGVLRDFDALAVTPSQKPEEPDRRTMRAQFLASLADEHPTQSALVPRATVGWQDAVDKETRHQTLAAILRLGTP